MPQLLLFLQHFQDLVVVFSHHLPLVLVLLHPQLAHLLWLLVVLLLHLE
nr:MAG TPA: hypothetical protein [Caudoviricetes sp.]